MSFRVSKCSLVLLLLGGSLVFAQVLQQGDAAFLPKLADAHGNAVDLAESPLTGHWLVFWFYPQTLSSECSLQAKRYSDLSTDFSRLNTTVFGISDGAETQCEFVEALFQEGNILLDRDRLLADAYGVDGVLFKRNTVLISPEGKVEKIWRNVEPLEDADTVLEYLKNK